MEQGGGCLPALDSWASAGHHSLGWAHCPCTDAAATPMGAVLSCGLTCLARAEAGVLWLPAPDRTRPPADCGARCGKPWGRGLPAPSPGLPAPSPRGSRSPGKWPWLCLRGAKCRPAGLAVCAWAGYQPQPSLTTPSLVRRGGGHGKRIP